MHHGAIFFPMFGDLSVYLLRFSANGFFDRKGVFGVIDRKYIFFPGDGFYRTQQLVVDHRMVVSQRQLEMRSGLLPGLCHDGFLFLIGGEEHIMDDQLRFTDIGDQSHQRRHQDQHQNRQRHGQGRDGGSVWISSVKAHGKHKGCDPLGIPDGLVHRRGRAVYVFHGTIVFDPAHRT